MNKWKQPFLNCDVMIWSKRNSYSDSAQRKYRTKWRMSAFEIYKSIGSRLQRRLPAYNRNQFENISSYVHGKLFNVDHQHSNRISNYISLVRSVLLFSQLALVTDAWEARMIESNERNYLHFDRIILFVRRMRHEFIEKTRVIDLELQLLWHGIRCGNFNIVPLLWIRFFFRYICRKHWTAYKRVPESPGKNIYSARTMRMCESWRLLIDGASAHIGRDVGQ